MENAADFKQGTAQCLFFWSLGLGARSQPFIRSGWEAQTQILSLSLSLSLSHETLVVEIFKVFPFPTPMGMVQLFPFPLNVSSPRATMACQVTRFVAGVRVLGNAVFDKKHQAPTKQQLQKVRENRGERAVRCWPVGVGQGRR